MESVLFRCRAWHLMKEAPLYALRRCGPLLAADSSRNQFEALRRVEALGYPISYVEGYWGAVRELLAGRGLYGFAAPNGDPFTLDPPRRYSRVVAKDSMSV